MKLNRLETHDRYQHFTKQDFSIGKCCQSLIDQRPFGEHPFYIFAHTRTDDDGVTKRLIWQPRLTKPKAQTNSMLFKVYPGSDNVRVIWVIPAPELWKQYQENKITTNQTVLDSINAFLFGREQLEMKEKDDLPDNVIQSIYLSIAQQARQEKNSTPKTSALSQLSSM